MTPVHLGLATGARKWDPSLPLDDASQKGQLNTQGTRLVVLPRVHRDVMPWAAPGMERCPVEVTSGALLAKFIAHPMSW